MLLFSGRRDDAPQAAELPRALSRAEAPRGLLLQFHHPQVALRLVVIERDSEVRHEPQHLRLILPEARHQRARLGLDGEGRA